MVLRRIGKILLTVGAGLLATVLLSLLAVKLALDRSLHYQAEIKNWLHGRIGYHIAFAKVAPAYRWYGPELSFEQLELRSKNGERVLAHASHASIGLDLSQLLHGGRLLAARVELDAPDVAIERIAADKFLLASDIELGGGRSGLPALGLDDLPAGTLVIHRGLIRVRGWNPALAQFELHAVELTLRRRAGSVTLAVQASLPAVLGGAVSFEAAARGQGHLDSLRWSAVARARDLAFAGWRQLMPEILSRLAAGTGGFEMAARGAGSNLERADLDFNAANVTTRLADEPGVTFDRVSGALTATHRGDRWTLLGRRVRAPQSGQRDPDFEFDVTWRGTESGLMQLRARATYLRAETLLPLAGLLPQHDVRERLQQLAPTGEWLDTHVDLERVAVGEPWKLGVGARFRGMGFAPAGRTPGLRGLTGTLAGNEFGGRIDIDTRNGLFTWPAQFLHPVAIEKLKTILYWRRTSEELLVATPAIALTTPDATLSARLAWHHPSDGGSPVLTLAGRVEDGDVADARLYLPRLHIPSHALAWLDRAFPAGHLSYADVLFQGPVRHFPFRDGSGLFLARAHVEHATLDYKEGWPRGEELSLLAEFRNEGLSVTLHGGRIGDLKLEKGDARFADFKKAELTVHVTASGDAADALAFLRATPLDAAAEHAFSGVEAKGPMRSDVEMFLPFKEFDHRRTVVDTHLDGVSLYRPGSSLIATELKGDAQVDGAQVSRADVQGRMLGGAFQMQARAPRNRPQTRTLLLFNGSVTGEALHSALSLPPSVPINGTTEWHGVLRMAPARERSLHLSGSLLGLALDLPEPLTKPAGAPLPSSIDIQWPSYGNAQVRLALGSLLRAQATLKTDVNGFELDRVAVSFGTGSPAEPEISDSQVLNTGGAIERLDLAGWLKLYSADKSAKPLGPFFRSAKFDVAQIDYLGLSFFAVSVDLAARDSGWRVDLGGPNVIGRISLPGLANVDEPWSLEFQRLKFIGSRETPTPGSAIYADRGRQPMVGPRGVPAMNFHAADVIWDDRRLGDVRAVLTRLDDGISLQRLTVSGDGFSATARGEWRGKEAGRARAQGTLISTDVGATMKDLGYDAVIEAKAGKLDFDMSWVGAPSAAALSVADGGMHIALDNGQLTAIHPGAGRVMGLASLAALPRRLSFDFSDLTDKGLAFDTIRGGFDLRGGSAYTDDVQVLGPAAAIVLKGRVGLVNKDYDQTAVVTGNMSSSLPLAAFAAGPVVGGAVLLASQVFKQPLKGLVRGYYRITGGWDSPTVERIKSADAAEATDGAPR